MIRLLLGGGPAIGTGKGNKLRPVYFGARTTRAADRYLRARSTQRWSHLDALSPLSGEP